MPHDLQAICLKCLEKAPSRRYASAAALEEDLRRFLAGQPTQARPLGAVARAYKWARRRPALATLVVVSLLAISTILGGALVYESRLRTALEVAEHETATTRDLLYTTDVRLAAEAIGAENYGEAAELLAGLIPAAGEPDRREFAWHYLWGLSHQELLTLRGHVGAVYHVAFAADGASLVTAGMDGTVRLWDAQTGEQRLVLSGHEGEVNNAEFVANDRLASAGDDGTVRIWEIDGGRQVHVLRTGSGAVHGLAVLPGGILAAGGTDGVLRFWNIDQGELVWESEATSSIETLAAAWPTLRLLASSHESGPLRIWSIEGRRVVAEPELPLDTKRSVIAASPHLPEIVTSDRAGI